MTPEKMKNLSAANLANTPLATEGKAAPEGMPLAALESLKNTSCQAVVGYFENEI